MLDGEIEFIDWTQITRGNQLRDFVSFISHCFFFYRSRALDRWENALEIYYDRKPTNEEIFDVRSYLICYMSDCISKYDYYRENEYFIESFLNEIEMWG